MNTQAFELCQSFLKDFEDYAERCHDDFRRANPFPHTVADDLLDERLIDRVLQEFPGNESPIWQRYDDKDVQVKLRSNWTSDSDIPVDTRELVRTLNSGRFLRALSRLTGINHLIADPYLTGGGLNAILRGGLLDIHCDGNWHDAMAVHRRLNAILYLNKSWQESWGGELEFWDRKMEHCAKKIMPVSNRLVVFVTNDFTFHGHPQPLNCPPDESRKSLILYYYTSAPREAEEIASADPHRALWRKRGQVTGSRK